jgi:hypothetical protein
MFSYTFKSYLGPDSSRTKILEFFEALLKSDDDFLLRTSERNEGKCPKFIKQEPRHILYKEVRYHHILPNLLREDPDLKLVLLLRNPLSTINSWLNAPREFRSDLGWRRTEEWRYALKKNLNRPEEFNGYERWKEASLMFFHLAKEHPQRIVVLNYAELLEDTYGIFEKAFAKLDLDYSEQTRGFLLESCSSLQKDAYSVFRDNPTDSKWIDQLEPEIVEAIRLDLKGSAIEFLLPDV